uniref:RNA-directed RNA polymerase L n=1 Tax=Blatta orientalis phasmavirus 3 TaxID=3133447 RepID=A0AAT9JNE5_9VIRU
MAWPPLPNRGNLLEADHLVQHRIEDVPWSIHMVDILQDQSSDFPLADQVGRCIFTESVALYHYSPMIDNIIPDPTVHVDGKLVTWEFHDYLGDTGSQSGSSSGVRPRAEFYKNRHDMVAEALGLSSTDIRLKDFFGPFDEDDILSPDYIHSTPDKVVHVLEFATSRDSSASSLRQVLEAKLLKYRFALEARARSLSLSICLSVVVVSPLCVVTNLLLPRRVIDSLGYRLRIACVIDDKASQAGVIFHEEQTMTSTLEAEIQRQVGHSAALPLRTHTPYCITESYYRFASTPLDHAGTQLIKEQAHSMVRAANHLLLQEPVTPAQAFQKLDKMRPDEETKSEKKPVTTLPVFVCRQDDDVMNNRVTNVYIPYHGCPLILDLWRQAFASYSTLEPEPSSEDPNYADGVYQVFQEDDDVPKSDTKHLYCRVKIDPSPDQRLYMAGQGIDGKRYKDHQYVVDQVRRSRMSYDRDTPVDDIDSYVQDHTWILEDADVHQTTFDNMSDLIKEADKLQGNQEELVGDLQRLHKTKLSVALQINSKIAQELAVSFRQHTERDQFILKKIRGFPIFLLIKTVNTRSHIFFSILTTPGSETESYGLPFPDMLSHEGFRYTGFRSFTAPKLSNQFVLNELWMGSLIRWTLELSPYTGMESQPHTLLHVDSLLPQALKMSLLALLVAMEDKASTEAEMTLSRFMYMEMFKIENEFAKPDPLKMVSKFCSYPRSRLLLWVQTVLIENFSLMLKTPPSAEALFKLGEAYTNTDGKRIVVPEFLGDLPDNVRPTDVSMDKWIGLRNCFTGDPIPSMSAAVNIMYTGYFKDKNEAPWENSDWKLVEKILEEEFKLDPSRGRFYGDEEPPSNDIRDHEFSPAHIKYGCAVAALQLTQKFGLSYQQELEGILVRRLSRTTLVDLATLKASAVIDKPSQLVLEDVEDIDRSANRIKAMEAAAKLADDLTSHPYTQLEYVIKKVEDEWGGIACDLFKKQQHAGLREIYVLEFHCRVVQRFVEMAGRILCEQFEIDTLSHPSLKHKLIDDHISSSLHMSDDSSKVLINCNSSGDKTRWNQNIMVKAYAIIFSQLFPERTAKALCRCLNLWYGKLIKIPRGLQKLLLSGTQLSNPIYDKLLSQFWGDGGQQDILVMEKKTKYFRTMSGMFQGILHYTSSMLHVIERLSYKQLCHLIFAKKYPEYPLKITVMCCSDDSSTMMTCAVPADLNATAKSQVKKLLTQLIYSQSHHGLYCNMRESVKSTLGTSSVLEYNSIFMCKGTVIVPTFKFWEAGLKLSQTESIKSRIENMYNLLRALAENSASAYECRAMQLLQASVFYKTLGSDLNPCWNLLKSELLRTHNIDLGFFPLDDELCPGLLGLKYNMFRAAVMGHYGKPLSRLFQAGAFDCAPGGELVSSAILTFGNRKRLERLQEEVELGPNWEGMVDESPEILYRQARSTHEAKLQITVASHQAGVHESLNMGNSFFNSITSSVYCANHPCISVRYAYREKGKIQTKKVKTSLISAIRICEEDYPVNSDVSIQDLFPNSGVYNQISLMLRRIKSRPLRPRKVPPLKRKLTTLLWQIDSELLEAPLSKSARLTWFGYTSRESARTLRSSWERQKVKIPWLRQTAQETLEASPFESHIGLRNFIDSHGSVSRTIRAVCPVIRSHTFLGQLEDMVKFNYMPGHLLVGTPTLSREEAFYKSGISSEVSLILLSPRSDDVKLSRIVNLMKSRRPVTSNITTLKKMTKSEAYLTIMHWVGQKVHSPETGFSEVEVKASSEAQLAVDALRTLRETFIDYVIFRQSVDEDNNPKGLGTTRLYLNDCNVQLDYYDDEVARVIVPDLESLYNRLSTVLEYVKWSGHKFRSTPAGGFFDNAAATISMSGLSAKRYKGSPVTLDDSLRYWDLDANDLGVLLEVNGDCVRLISRQRYTTRMKGKLMNYFTKDQSLCFYKASSVHTEIPKRGPATAVEDFDQAWFEGRPLDSVRLASLIHYLMETQNESLKMQVSPLGAFADEEYLTLWLRATFRARIGHTHGIFPTPTKRDIEEPPTEPILDVEGMFGEDDFFGDDDWGETMDQIIESLNVTEPPVQDAAAEEMETLFSEFGDEGLQTYFETLSSQQTMGSSKETIYSHHPFWDDFVKEAEIMHQGIIKRVARGRYGGPQKLSDQLCWLLERKPLKKPVKSKLELFYEELGEVNVLSTTPRKKEGAPKARTDVLPSEPTDPEPRVWKPSFMKKKKR